MKKFLKISLTIFLIYISVLLILQHSVSFINDSIEKNKDVVISIKKTGHVQEGKLNRYIVDLDFKWKKTPKFKGLDRIYVYYSNYVEYIPTGYNPYLVLEYDGRKKTFAPIYDIRNGKNCFYFEFKLEKNMSGYIRLPFAISHNEVDFFNIEATYNHSIGFRRRTMQSILDNKGLTEVARDHLLIKTIEDK